VLAGVDGIVHLAAANEMRSAANPEAAILETGGGTRLLLEAAIAEGVKRFVFMSTIHVYGSPLSGHLSETTLPRPSHPYAISHMVGENYVFAAHAARRIEGVSVRLSNGIGAPAWRDVERWTLVGNDFVRQATEKGEIVVKTPGQWRDFIPLADICSGVEILLTVSSEALGLGVFNLGGEMPMRIVDVARRTVHVAKTVLTRPVTLRAISELNPSDGPPFKLDIAAVRDLGFNPSGFVGLDRELLATFHLLNA
jgi:UDP-glucose 4-epimerase